MTVDALVLRATNERSDSERIREKAERDLERVREAAKRIRHMTKLYRERLEGKP